MNTLLLKILITFSLLFLIIITGIWLTKSGRPLNSKIFAIHKIISVSTIVLSFFFISQITKQFGISQMALIFLILTIVFIVSEIVTGTLLSFEKPISTIILLLHKIIPILIIVCSGFLFYFLTLKR